MKATKHSSSVARSTGAFDTHAFPIASGQGRTSRDYGRGETIFTQGEPCAHVMYVQSGGVRMSALSKAGREATVAILGAGNFFGEGCLAGQPVRMGTATAITPSLIVSFGKNAMKRLLHRQHAMSDRFISHMVSRNIQIEEDLLEQTFHSTESRLARALLLARDGSQDKTARTMPTISQQSLATMVGMTRSRVSFFLKKFDRLGFIEYNGKSPLTIHSSLLNVILQD